MKRKAFMGVITKLYNKGAEDLADMSIKLSDDNNVELEDLNDDEVASVLQKLDGEKVTGFKTKLTEKFNDGVKKGEGKKAGDFEKKLKTAFEVDDTDLTGDELIDHIKENIPVGEGKTDLTKFTEDELKKVPAFKKINQAHNKALADLKTAHEQELAAEKDNAAKGEVFSEVAKSALTLINGKKLLLPEDASKREQRLQKLLIDELKGKAHSWKKEGANFIPLDKEGVPLEDENGKVLDLNSMVDKIADDNFDPAPEEVVQTPNNKNQQQRQQQQQQVKKPYTGKVPTNKDEYLDLLLDQNTDIDTKVALKDNYSGKFA